MNKKIIKIILIISGILLLSGFGIYGYKYIKNKNSGKVSNENETELREISGLTKAGQVTTKNGSYNIDVYYNKVVSSKQYCSYFGGSKEYFIYPTTYYVSLYVNGVKLKGSWRIYDDSFVEKDSSVTNAELLKTITADYNYHYKLYLISVSHTTKERTKGTNSYCSSDSTAATTTTDYPYTKIFTSTGDLAFAVPTNSNEIISNLGYINYSGLEYFNNNMILNYFYYDYTIFYAKAYYNPSTGITVKIHKVTFNSSSGSYNTSVYYDNVSDATVTYR